MAKSVAVSWPALFVLSQIICLAVGEKRLECVRDVDDYNKAGYEWFVGPFYTWKYASTAETLPRIFKGKLNGTGIFYADGADGTGINTFIRDAEEIPTVTPGYLYVKYYLHRTNASNVNLIARPAKGDNGFVANLPTNDDFRWQEQLIEVDVEAADSIGFWVGIMARNMTSGQYLLVDTIALLQGEILSTAVDAAALCSQAPASLPIPRNPKMKPSFGL